MKNNINNGIAWLFFTALFLGSCKDERALVVAPDNFQVKITDYTQLVKDTFIVKLNENVTFSFPEGCPDEILFYSGELGKEYRFGTRGTYKLSDSTFFESKIAISTAVNSFDGSLLTDYSLISISGLGTSSVSEFNKATKKELMKLRSAGAASASSIRNSFTINNLSTPINLTVGDVNLAIKANSTDATKNLLSIIASTDTIVNNVEIRDYSYVRNGVKVVNKKTIKYPIITNTFSAAGWAQYAPDSTIAPGTIAKVLNASGYSWNMGEIGVSYAPTITVSGAVVSANKNGVTLAAAYPLSVTVPKDETKVVTDGSPSEGWLISRPFNPATVLSDAAIIVKKVDQSSMLNYQNIYKEKGVYKASFVGINVGTNGTAKVVREFVILVQ